MVNTLVLNSLQWAKRKIRHKVIILINDHGGESDLFIICKLIKYYETQNVMIIVYDIQRVSTFECK